MSDLRALVADELARPVDPRVAAMARAVAATYGQASRAVLFYGSCLRIAPMEGPSPSPLGLSLSKPCPSSQGKETASTSSARAVEQNDPLHGQMLDFYLIVSDYRAAYGRGWLAPANRLIPPNVFPFTHDDLAAKYAVLSEDDFRRLASSRTDNVSVWARFAQPARLVWVRDAEARERAEAAVAGAAPALLRAARPLLADRLSVPELWRDAFALTYAAELRAERGDRAGSVVDADPERYRAFTAPALAAARLVADVEADEVAFARPITPAERRAGVRAWARRRRRGKALTLLRLTKASGTFAGGLDYLAWKINRHAAADIAIRPWQRRWPLLGALTLLPRLLARGAVK